MRCIFVHQGHPYSIKLQGFDPSFMYLLPWGRNVLHESIANLRQKILDGNGDAQPP